MPFLFPLFVSQNYLNTSNIYVWYIMWIQHRFQFKNYKTTIDRIDNYAGL